MVEVTTREEQWSTWVRVSLHRLQDRYGSMLVVQLILLHNRYLLTITHAIGVEALAYGLRSNLVFYSSSCLLATTYD